MTCDRGAKAGRILIRLSFRAVVTAGIGKTDWSENAKAQRLSPEIDQIAPESVSLEHVASGLKRLECPVGAPAGYLLFAKILNSQGTGLPG